MFRRNAGYSDGMESWSRADVLLLCIGIILFGLGFAIERHLSRIASMMERFLHGPPWQQ
jgi:hypothetical protein